MNFFLNKNLRKSEEYFLPLASFFLLVIFGSIRIILEHKYFDKIDKKFMLYGLLIFIFLILSSYYSSASFESIYITLKKYIKFLYIPILFYFIRIQNNQKLIIKFFLAGSMIVLLLSYLKYFNIVSFTNIYGFFDMNLFMTLSKATVFQSSIVHGAVFSFIFYLSVYLAKNQKNNWLYLYAFLCFINVIYMNDSRNSYIVAFFLILLIIYFYLNSKKYMVTTVSLLFIFTLLSPISETLTKTLYDTKDDINLLIDKNYTSSIGLRSLWAINGINNIYEKPLFGIGVGGYEDSISNFISKNNINVQENLAVSNNPHNEFVSISTQLGLFGLMLYTLFLYSLFKEARNNFLRSGVFVLVFVSSFFNSTFYDNVFGLFIVMIISLVYQKHFNE